MASNTQKLQLSQRIAIPLSIIMISAAVLTFIELPDIGGSNPPIFTTTRVPVTGEHFLKWRHKTTPSWLYQVLHAAPAIVWCLLMPFQHVDKIRRKWPVLHRSTGYIILSISLLLNVSGYVIILKYAGDFHADILHLHSFSGFSPIQWPSFHATTLALGLPYSYTLYRTAVTARAKNIEKHRQWALTHTLVAYAISVERFSLFASYAIGWAVALYGKVDFWKNLPYDDTIASKVVAEQEAFALTNIGAFVLVVAWFVYEWGRKGYLSLPKVAKSFKVE